MDAILILKGAIEDEDFLAAAMNMNGKIASGRKSHETRRPRNFPANSVEIEPVYAFLRRLRPLLVVRTHHDALREVSVNFH